MVFKREVKQEIIAHIQKIKSRITNKNTKIIIHKNISANVDSPILQHYIGF